MTTWTDGPATVHLGDVREVVRALPDASVDAIVTDPPAGISFMGKGWDTFPTRQRPTGHAFADGRSRPGIAGGQEYNLRAKDIFVSWLADVMTEARRVLKPGALGLVWAIPRTAHWTADALEEAGFEIHPNGFIAHHFASGFPKAKTHLKPATEVWWLVRKPGRGNGLNINACRVEGTAEMLGSQGAGDHLYGNGKGLRAEPSQYERHPGGRWPANLVLSHGEGCRPVGTRRVQAAGWRDDDQSLRERSVAYNSAHDGSLRGTSGRHYADADGLETVESWECEPGCPVAELDRQSGTLTSGFMPAGTERSGDRGGASRFFYVAKASAAERSAGLPPGERNTHPTVKPLELMRWLVRLATPSGGRVLDPFMGSGTTGCAALLEGYSFTGIEQEEESAQTAIARLRHWVREPSLDLDPERAR